MHFDELYVDSLSSVAQAVEMGDPALLKTLIEKRCHTDRRDNRGWTPLHLAASKGFVEGVRLLLTADDVKVESMSHFGLSALYLACCNKTDHDTYKEIVEMLLGSGADPNMTAGDTWVLPLHAAAENNNIEVVKLLLRAGANPNRQAFKSTTALHSAAEVGACEVAQLLMEKGADVNITSESSGYSALHALCLHYNPELEENYNGILSLFLASSIDINAQTTDGTTPLMLAIQKHWDWAVDQFLQKGVDVNLKKSNLVLALHFAIQFSSCEKDKSATGHRDGLGTSSILQKILSRTSHKEIPRQDYSIFHLAIQWKRYEGVQILIDSGLRPDEFLQEMESAIIDCDESDQVPLVVQIDIFHDTPLGFLLFQSLTREVVDTAKYMIDKGSSVNALNPGVLPPLVAALKNRHPTTYDSGGLGQEILQYLLDHGADVMHKTRENEVLPVAFTVASLFNVVGFFRLLQHGAPAHSLYTQSTLLALRQHYQTMPCYTAFPLFPWLVLSWLTTANLFVPQLPFDTVDIFKGEWNVPDEHLNQAWCDLETQIASPKSLKHLCVLEVRRALGEASGWGKLQRSINQLQTVTPFPEPVMDQMLFRWVETNTLQLNPPPSAMPIYDRLMPSPSPFITDDEDD